MDALCAEVPGFLVKALEMKRAFGDQGGSPHECANEEVVRLMGARSWDRGAQQRGGRGMARLATRSADVLTGGG